MGSSLLRLTGPSSLGLALARLWHTHIPRGPRLRPRTMGCRRGGRSLGIDGRSLDRAAGLAAAALVIELASSSRSGESLDRRLFQAVNRGGGRGADRILAGVTELGSITASAGAAGVLAAGGRRRVAG